MSPIPARTRAAVLARDGYSCQRCDRNLIGQQYSIQHRRGRGMGSSRDAHLLSNLVLMCGTATTPDGCHAWAEAHPQEAFELGWSVRRNSVDDTEQIPMTRTDGSQFFLTDDGGLITVIPRHTQEVS